MELRLTPGGLNRLLEKDVQYLQEKGGKKSLSPHLRKLKEYKHHLDAGTLPTNFYRIVVSPFASGRVPKDPWWRNRLDFAIEETDKALMLAFTTDKG